MRVVGGIYRSRELVWPKSALIRPSKDIVRQGLFNALGSKVTGSVVLDLFSGSGALAIEAISRGAKFSYLVDHNREALHAIMTNLARLKIDNVDVMKTDYRVALDKLKSQNAKIDILFLDPPYKMDNYLEMINLAESLLNEDAVIVIESDHSLTFEIKCKRMKEYEYGKSKVTIIWR